MKEAMKTLFDSILLNRLQMESSSSDVLLNCIVYESDTQYESDIILSSSAMNQLLNELALRGIELNFEEDCDQIILPDGELLCSMDFTNRMDQPIFLPLYSMPEQVRLLRA